MFMAKKKEQKKRRKKIELDVLIVAKQNKIGIKLAKKLEKMLSEYTDDVHFDHATALKLRKRGVSIRKFTGDFIITIGGDGTLLWTASKANVPILPVKIEGYGFLCTATFKDVIENFDKLIKKDFTITERMRLRCSRIRTGRIEKYIEKILHSDYPMALNEITFGRRRPSKILDIEFIIDDVAFDCVGDGLIFSTQSGSTAYSASAGGPIIDKNLAAYAVVPLYPFFSKLKPIIVPLDKQIEVEIKSGECALIIDGHGGEYVKSGTRYLIEKGKPVKIISLAEQNFYEKLRKDLIS
jgi:NAD+ kinase